MQRLLRPLIALAILTSCSPSEGEQMTDSKAIQLIDHIGQFEGDIGGLQFWHHPVNNYEGGIVAANGEAGLVFISIEGVASQAVPGAFFVKPDIVYPEGHEALIFAPDRNRNELVAIRKNNNGTELAEVSSYPLDDKEISGFCMMDSLRGIFIQNSGHAIYREFDNENSVTPLSAKAKYSACKFDPVTGRLFLSTRKGNIVEASVDGDIIKRFSPNLGKGFEFDLFREKDRGLFLIAFSNNRGIVLPADDQDSGKGFHFMTNRGRDAVEAVQHFTMTGGNLGSIYRNGAIAVIDSNHDLYFAPWTGFSKGSDGQEAITLGPRPPRETDEEEGLPAFQLDSAFDLPGLSGADQ